MNKLVTIILAFSVAFSFSAERYKDRMFDVFIQKNVVYASNVNHLKKLNPISTALLTYSILDDASTSVYLYDNETDMTEVDLHMDIYSPKGDNEVKRAAVVVLHGGAFAAGDKADMNQQSITYCDSLAARGYVAIAVEYRLGITAKFEDNKLTIDSLDFSRTVYRGIQDVRAAIRYLRSNSEKLGIDPNRIYVIGNSAGGILSLENLYMDKDNEIPSVAKNEPDLGTLDEYGIQGLSSEANAAVSLWGAVHDINIIEDNSKPVLLVHGKADSTVYFKTGRPLGNIAGLLENIMPSAVAYLGSMSFSVNTPTLYGSFVIDSVLKAKGVAHETYFIDGMSHEFYDEDDFDVKVKNKVFDFLYAQTQNKITDAFKPIMHARINNLRMGKNNMSFTINSGKDCSYKIFDIRGNVKMHGNVSAGEVINLNALHSGIYILKLKGGNSYRFGLKH